MSDNHDMASKSVSSGAVFKAFLGVATSRASTSGTKVDQPEAKAALDTFGWSDEKVTQAEVIAARVEFAALKKAGRLTAAGEKTFTDWFASVGDGVKGGFTYDRSAAVFDNASSFFRWNPNSQKGAILTKGEARALVELLGPTPAPARIVDVADLKQAIPSEDAKRVLAQWLDAHPLPVPDARLSGALRPVTTGLLWPSETDRPVIPVSLGRAPSPRQNVLAALRTALGEGATTPVERRAFAAQFDQLTSNFDPADPASVARAQRFGQLRAVLEAQLTDLEVFRLGGTRKDVYVLGRDAQGQWVGVMSGVVET